MSSMSSSSHPALLVFFAKSWCGDRESLLGGGSLISSMHTDGRGVQLNCSTTDSRGYASYVASYPAIPSPISTSRHPLVLPPQENGLTLLGMRISLLSVYVAHAYPPTCRPSNHTSYVAGALVLLVRRSIMNIDGCPVIN
jgi:hypothetical protein